LVLSNKLFKLLNRIVTRIKIELKVICLRSKIAKLTLTYIFYQGKQPIDRLRIREQHFSPLGYI